MPSKPSRLSDRRGEKLKKQAPKKYAHMYGHKWRKSRAIFLSDNPLCQCEECAKLPLPRPANVVDHIIPHKGDYKLFWSRRNWQAMSKKCHDRKTATRDGGFGRPVSSSAAN